MTHRIWAGALLLLLAIAPYAPAQQEAPSLLADGEQVDGGADEIDETLLPIGEGEEGVGEVASERAIGFGDVVRMLLVLGAVIVVIYITFALLKRAGRSQIQSSPIIHNISTILLGGNRSLHVICVGERYYLVGSAEQSVGLIEAIEDDETIEFIRQHKNDPAPAGDGSFKSRMRALLRVIQKPNAGARDAAGAKAPNVPNAAEVLRRIAPNHRRLKGM